MTPQEIQQFQQAVNAALAANPDFQKYAGVNSPEAIVNAFMTGDWSNVTNITGVPFTKAQQQEAVRDAEKALDPAFRAQETYDRSVTEDALRGDQQGFSAFQRAEKDAFGEEKDAIDQNAADSGVLFSGSRMQKLNDLRSTYQDREATMRGQVADRMRTTGRNYQYNYGTEAARGLRDLYQVPETSSFNSNIAGGKVTRGSGLSSLYNPKEFNFQGTVPNAHRASVQTRAASLLGNRANKLTASGYKTQF